MELRLRYQSLRHKFKSRVAKRSAAALHLATLTTLPVEILNLILGYLCKHCSRPADLELSDLDDGKRALRSLCLVCRALRPAAQAFLVHSLWLRFGLRGFRKQKDDSNFAVLRTLIEYPELAASVRKITLGGSEMVLGPERLGVVRDAERKRTFCTGSAPSSGTEEVSFTRLTRDLFVSLTQNLTNLSFPLGFRRGENRTADLAAAVRFAKQTDSVNHGASLLNLQILTLFPERGADFVLNDPRISIFLSAAPNLRTLVIAQVADIIDFVAVGMDQSSSASHQAHLGPFLDELPIMHHLKSIHLQNCLVADDASGRNLAGLQTLLAVAPNLRRFQFSPGFNINFNTLAGSRVLSILEPFYDTLVDLGLRYSAAMSYLEGGTDSLQGISRFSRLQVLRLDEAAYCRNRHPGQPEADSRNIASGDPVAPECLTRILPQSVQVLHLELMYGCTEQYDALCLAAHIARGRFPNLRHVQIEANMRPPPHGAVQLRKGQQATDAGLLSLSRDELDVVTAFMESNIGVWIRNAGWFDDWDVEAFLDL